MATTEKTKNLKWKVHTPSLLQEIMNNNETAILNRPLQIFGFLLHDVAERASQLNDERLNELMVRLTLYEAADPNSKGYDRKLVEKYS
jgi:hypothetical protein